MPHRASLSHAELEEALVPVLRGEEHPQRDAGCELYGTSRACPISEAAAASARIARLFWGEALIDAGPPRLR
jgi:tRNA(Arg) A34 adenosine deaminase TadA